MENTEQKSIPHHGVQTTLAVIRDRMEEVLGEEELMEKITVGKTLRVYWGTAPTGPPSFAYFLPLLKLKDLLNAGMGVTILLADVHSYMDRGLMCFDKTLLRTVFYEVVLKEMLTVIGVDPSDIDFVRGSSYQLDETFNRDLLRLSSVITVGMATKASSEVVKQTKDKDTLISHLLYPLMQALDETYLNADLELGGRDQRKILTFSRDNIHKIGYSKCSYAITPLIPSLRGPGKKMSSSDPNSKLSFMDSNEFILEKISKAYCADRDVDLDRNPLLAIVKFILFPFFKSLETYVSYDALYKDWSEGTILAQDLKKLVGPYVVKMIEPVRQAIEANQELYDCAYG
jgi:tyrosyl-tRNA synthetase